MLSKKLGGEQAAKAWWTELAGRIGTARDAEDAVRELADAMAKDIDPYAFGVFLENPAAHELVLKHRAAHGPLRDVPTAVHPEQGMVGFVYRHGVPLVVHDVTKDPRYIRGPLADSVTALAVPVRAGHEVVGAIDIEAHEAWSFDNTDIDGMVALASALGSALAKSSKPPSRPPP